MSLGINKILVATILLSSLLLMIGASNIDSLAINESNNISTLLSLNSDYIKENISLIRLIPISFSIIFLFLIYLWGKSILGSAWGILPMALLAFSPTYIAYSHFFTEHNLRVYAVALFVFFGSKLFSAKFIIYTFIPVILISLFFYNHGFGDLGALLDSNSWSDFFLIYLLREPLALLAIIATSFIFGAKNILLKIKNPKRSISSYITINPEEFFMILFIPIYSILLIIQGKAQIEHIYGLLPIIYMLSSSGIKNFVKNGKNQKIKSIMIGTFFFIYAFNSTVLYPNYPSYSNELLSFYGDKKYLLTHQYDLGTDLKKLNQWLENNNIQKIGLDYHGDTNPSYYLADKYVEWESSYGRPFNIDLDYLAISVKNIHKSQLSENPERKYLWLEDIDNPIYTTGNIWIYKLN